MRQNLFLNLITIAFIIISCNSDINIKVDSGDIITMSSEDYLNTIVDAYIYGYPLLLMNYTKELGTNVIEPHPTIPRAPINQLGHYRKFPDHTSKGVVKPNVDTYYSVAWFDLSKGPQVLSMPSTDRYYLLSFYDAFTNVFASPGTRTHGSQALTLLVVGPDYQDGNIEGILTIQSPTHMAWMIARIETYDNEDGGTVVRDIQDLMDLRPLSAVGDSSYTAPKGVKNISYPLPPIKQMESLSVEEFMNQLNDLLITQQTASYDDDIINRLKNIGIQVGARFELPEDNFVLKQKLGAIPKVIHKRFRERKANPDPTLMKNNWTMITSKLGYYRDDYLSRSYVSFVGLGANLTEDAIYPFTTMDSDGNLLDGSQKYQIHMEPDEVPPVRAFWSLTAYNEDDFLIKNEYNKFAINSKDSLLYNEDGSLDLFISAEPSIDMKTENWIPVNNLQNFTLTLRLYWPEEPIMNGNWDPPSVIHVK